MDSEQTLKPPLNLLDVWLVNHVAEFEKWDLVVSITWGPADRNPAAAWLDFQSGDISSRLTVWAGGNAELTIGKLNTNEVLLEEHREITTEIGLDDVARTIESWLHLTT